MSGDKITLKQLLSDSFSENTIQINNQVVFGKGAIQDRQFNILGTLEDTNFGVDEAMEMAEHVLKLLQEKNKDPILLLVDVTGQKLSVRDEWLGMYAYFGHLLQCLQAAREQGNKIISLIYNQAIGGSFIAFGMMADRIIALENTQLAVMWLEGMAKVTKIDIEVLRELSKTSPVFAPGVENFKKLGGIHEVLALKDVGDRLVAILKEPDIYRDNRAQLGKKYGGRTLAYDLIERIKNL